MTNPTARRPVLFSLLVCLLVSSGCTSGPEGMTADEAAEDVASALSSGRLDRLEYVGGTPRQAQALWKRTLEGMRGSKPKVEVEQVDEGEDGKPTTVQLSYAWRLVGSEEPWSYRTEARLTQNDSGAWRVRLAPSLVFTDLKKGERLELDSTLAPRADILGAGGTPIVTERRVLRFGIDKTRVKPAREAASARALARVVDVDADEFAERVQAAGDRAWVEAIVLRAADALEVLSGRLGDIEGVGILRDTLPLAPTREFARPILGTVGAVTAEIVKKSGGLYEADDEAGLSGLEQRYDERLRGTPGVVVRAINAKGEERELFDVGAQEGEPLATTIDVPLQKAAENVLSGVGPASALVAIRPSSGDILAAASGLGSGGLSTATVGQYAPGSTFKVVSSLALLRSGVKPSTTVSCPRTTVVDGKSFKNYDDYPASGIGRIPFATAIANSCNTALIGQRGKVSQAELADAAASLGLGVDHDLGFPAYFGSVPAIDAEAGSETGHAASLIGQGKVQASPMAMAAVAASVAEGRAVVPRLLPDQEPATADPRVPLTRAEAAQLRSLMRGVVTRGSGAFLADAPGAPVLAKTGTAEFGDDEPLQTHVWMIAVQGDLAVAVFVDVGESGSRTAGPLLESFLRQAR